MSHAPASSLPAAAPVSPEARIGAPALTAGEVAASGSRGPLALAIGMLFLGALPDGAVAPLLNDLFVQRYGVSAAASHWFMMVNLIGALAIVPVLARLRRRLPPSIILAGAASMNALLLASMALPIGFAWTLGIRIFEGAADLVMLAVLFDLLGKAGASRRRGARLGAAGTVLLLGVAAGVGAGGAIGGVQPSLVFCFGAIACLIVAAFALAKHASFDGLVRSCPVVADDGVMESRGPLWPALVMTGCDRAVAGVVVTTLVLYFAQALEMAPPVRGSLLGASILLLALGAWPAGVLGDRIGHLKLRVGASILYAASLAAIPFIAAFGTAAIALMMMCFGLAGAALMPTSLALACRSGRGSVAMGAYHASGNLGYHIVGIGGAALLLTVLAPHGEAPGASVYHAIILGFAGAHLVISLTAAAAMRRTCDS